MHPDRIAELLAPFLETPPANGQRLSSSPEQGKGTNDALYHNISTYIDILLHWNARINLTAIRDAEEIVTRHFGESLFAARHLFPTPAANPAAERRQNAADGVSRGSGDEGDQAPEGRKKISPNVENIEGGQGSCQDIASSGADAAPKEIGASAPGANDQRSNTNTRPTVADVGSGAGFPGLPIKLWAPQTALTLIESNHKKATFLREVTRALTLTDVNILSVRAEQLSHQPPAQTTTDACQSFNVVTLRAVEHFEDALHIAAKLVAPAGRLALLIGTSQLTQVRSTLPSLDWGEPIPVPVSRSRTIMIGTRTEVDVPRL
jgi:16S rRNA (guanine(527)-N(7))-methyltransferase RsmG